MSRPIVLADHLSITRYTPVGKLIRVETFRHSQTRPVTITRITRHNAAQRISLARRTYSLSILPDTSAHIRSIDGFKTHVPGATALKVSPLVTPPPSVPTTVSQQDTLGAYVRSAGILPLAGVESPGIWSQVESARDHAAALAAQNRKRTRGQNAVPFELAELRLWQAAQAADEAGRDWAGRLTTYVDGFLRQWRADGAPPSRYLCERESCRVCRPTKAPDAGAPDGVRGIGHRTGFAGFATPGALSRWIERRVMDAAAVTYAHPTTPLDTSESGQGSDGDDTGTVTDARLYRKGFWADSAEQIADERSARNLGRAILAQFFRDMARVAADGAKPALRLIAQGLLEVSADPGRDTIYRETEVVSVRESDDVRLAPFAVKTQREIIGYTMPAAFVLAARGVSDSDLAAKTRENGDASHTVARTLARRMATQAATVAYARALDKWSHPLTEDEWGATAGKATRLSPITWQTTYAANGTKRRSEAARSMELQSILAAKITRRRAQDVDISAELARSEALRAERRTAGLHG